MKRAISTILGALIFCALISAKEYTQVVRGEIIDRDANIPLIGATILIDGTDPAIGTITDVDGNFRFEQVPVGRINLILSYVGYENKVIPNIIVESGKEIVLKLDMQESLENMEAVVVRGNRKRGEVIDEMAILSARTFTVEESGRYAGSLSDPSRAVSAFAGVSSNPEGNNDIVVRGNSPKGISWRLEGIEIPSPNHFSDEGSSGGPISALNSTMLSNSDFFTGAFAPEFGNVLSGVFDMKLRSGNNEKREYTFGLGALGTDISLEGPFSRDYSGSYIANYRYSSLAMLDQVGLVDFDGVPKYQDGAFKFHLPTTNYGTFSLFGIGGISSINATETTEDEETIIEKGKYSANMGVMGLNHLYQINSKSFIKSSISTAINGSSEDFEELDDDSNFRTAAIGSLTKNTHRAAIKYSNKLNAKNRIIVGANYTHYFYNMNDKKFDEDLNRMVTKFDFKTNTGLVQSFVSWKHRFNDKLTFVGGAHYMNFTLNNSQAFEPRLGLKWQLNPKQSINVGYGKHSRVENILSYNIIMSDINGQDYKPNKDLNLSKANHFILGYEYRINNNLNAKIELYHQGLYDIPVENIDTSYFSLINDDMDYINKALVNEGTGKNYGIDFTLERYFNNNYYFLLTGSLYDSKYKSLEGVERNTKYNGNYAINFLIGKEFNLGDKNSGKTLAINTKIFYNGGRRYVPLNLDASIAEDDDVFHYNQAWEKRKSDIFQLNLSASLKINKLRTTHEIVIDILNAGNNQAKLYEYYDSDTKGIEYGKQLSMIPNLMYRIYF